MHELTSVNYSRHNSFYQGKRRASKHRPFTRAQTCQIRSRHWEPRADNLTSSKIKVKPESPPSKYSSVNTSLETYRQCYTYVHKPSGTEAISWRGGECEMRGKQWVAMRGTTACTHITKQQHKAIQDASDSIYRVNQIIVKRFFTKWSAWTAHEQAVVQSWSE